MLGIIMAFQNFSPIKGIFGSEFVGFQNFSFFFTSLDWVKVTWNTVFLNFLFIVTGLFFQLFFAILLSTISNKHFKKISQSFTLLPYFISWPIVGMFSVAFFASDIGIINSIMSFLGMNPINFYQNPNVWPLTLVMLRIWKSTGYGMIIYLAAIAGIDTEIYEAAKTDGATKLQRIRFITIPLLKSTTIMLLILALGKIFYGDFGMMYAIVGDNPLLLPTTDVIDTFVFRALRVYGDMGMSSAVGLYQSVVGFILVLTSNYIVRKVDNESALF